MSAVTNTTDPTTTTLSPCGYPPALLNGEIVRITSATAEYSCLTGFAMSGVKTIVCTGSNWATNLPSCAIIDQSAKITVFADWWQYFLAALLSFIALILLAFLIWCCCCGTHSAKVFPAGSRGPAYCCYYGRKPSTSSSAHDEVHDSQRYYHPPSNLIEMEDGVYLVPVNQKTQKLTSGTVIRTDSPMTTSRSGGQIKFVQVVQEVVEDDKNRKKAKDVNQWMPHSHPVRNINTSTK